MAGVGGAAAPGRLSLAGAEARPTELNKRASKRASCKIGSSVILSEAKDLNLLNIRDSSVAPLPQNDRERDFCKRLKRLLFVILSVAKNLSLILPPRFATKLRSVQNDMNNHCLFRNLQN